MKRPKDRLHKVVVIGANPAGIAAANKLGELGIPVTLVDRDANLDRKLANEAWQLNSGIPLNHAHRPGLIRILRNPGIQCVLPAAVTGIRHTPQGFRVGLARLQTFADPERCILCGPMRRGLPGLDGQRPQGGGLRRPPEPSRPAGDRQAASAPVPGKLPPWRECPGIRGPGQGGKIRRRPRPDPGAEHPARHLRAHLQPPV